MNKMLLYSRNVTVATVHMPLAIVGLYKANPDDNYGWNLLLSLDEFGNTVTGGDPGETISSRAGKAMLARKPWGCVLCKFLNLFQTDHCLKSINAKAGGAAVIPDDTP